MAVFLTYASMSFKELSIAGNKYSREPLNLKEHKFLKANPLIFAS